eukprot:TRINITY_DN19595_c0_g1_i1.p1 TRINITY_DN19595_c0_g1~~TRINITY_DN19595_c0_g1_i1.p1  ORF type:complete len:643 (+),score=93.57 TRINITY_DN19595_c0_g1_i1:188-2116(+)
MKAKWVTNLSLSLPSSISLTKPILRNSYSTLTKVDLSTILSLCGRELHFRHGSSLHASILKNPNFHILEVCSNHRHTLVVWNSLIHMYVKWGNLSDAHKVFDEMPIKDTVSWNSLISGYIQLQEFGNGFFLFKKMWGSMFFRFDQATLTTVLSACDSPDRLYVVKMIHSIAFVSGFEEGITVGNALVTGYFKCGSSGFARQTFDEMPKRNVVSWTAVISGLVQSQFCEESMRLFVEMRHSDVDANSLTYSSSLTACSGMQAIVEGRQIHALVLKSGVDSDLCIESSLMDMYSKCNSMEDACLVFESAEEFDEVSMTVMLVGFAQNGLEEKALELFVTMMTAGIEIDANMVSAILGVFGVIISLSLGKQIHSLVIKKCLGFNTFVANGLINMYSKCGEFGESIRVFNQTNYRNSVSWNCMIAGFARHGHGLEALQFYENMKLEGVEPTDITFLSLLHACSHVGSIKKGMELFDSMSEVHGISPRMEHYACVVDMLGRAGHLEEAKCFIEGMPIEPSVLVWQALLGACSMHGNLEVGRYASDHLLRVAPECSAAYVLMANIYSSQGRWKERARIIKRMKEMGVKKETGMSWIEVEKEVHSFVVEDLSHPQANSIYEVLDELIAFMIEEGYVPDKRFVLYDLGLG